MRRFLVSLVLWVGLSGTLTGEQGFRLYHHQTSVSIGHQNEVTGNVYDLRAEPERGAVGWDAAKVHDRSGQSKREHRIARRYQLYPSPHYF